MARINYRNRSYFMAQDPRIVEALDDIATAVANGLKQVNASPSGAVTAPSSISSLQVTASQGIFDIAIQDNSPVSRGVNYFLEYSTTSSFDRPAVIDLGASRNYRANFGNQTLYFRAYSQYPTSRASSPVYFGSQADPAPVVGGGTSTGPAPLPSAGSGTAPTNGFSGGAGFGFDDTRGNPVSEL